MPIRGLSEKRRLPRVGKIKLGLIVQEPGKRPYPRATDYFVCPETVTRTLRTPQPRALEVMFPHDDPAVLFPQEYKMYRTSGLYCRGDGEIAHRWSDEGQLVERECPCPFLEEGKCKPLATLNFLLPDVPGVGVWQINTSNQRSIIGLNSSLEQFSRTFGGLAGIPFTLRLQPEQYQRWDERDRKMKAGTLQVMSLTSELTLRQIVTWRSKVGAPVAALMPAAEITREEATEPTPAIETEIEDPVAQERETLWTLFMDACGQDPEKAGKLGRNAVKRHLGRAVEGLADLTPDEVRTLLTATVAEQRGN